MTETERGYTICGGRGGIRKGPEVRGTTNAVAIPIKCPSGSKPVGLMHTHPAGSLQLSPKDLKTMHEKKIPVCIRAGNKVKCWRPKK